jgi:hypothetical protein
MPLPFLFGAVVQAVEDIRRLLTIRREIRAHHPAAPPTTSRSPHRATGSTRVSLPKQNSDCKARPMAAVICREKCVGFLINRGPSGFEAIDAEERSRGTFPNELAAIAALFDKPAAAS